MESSRRDHLNDMAEQRFILNNNQNTNYPCVFDLKQVWNSLKRVFRKMSQRDISGVDTRHGVFLFWKKALLSLFFWNPIIRVQKQSWERIPVQTFEINTRNNELRKLLLDTTLEQSPLKKCDWCSANQSAARASYDCQVGLVWVRRGFRRPGHVPRGDCLGDISVSRRSDGLIGLIRCCIITTKRTERAAYAPKTQTCIALTFLITPLSLLSVRHTYITTYFNPHPRTYSGYFSR